MADFCYLTNRYALLTALCADGAMSPAEREALAAVVRRTVELSTAVRLAQPDSHEGKVIFIRSHLLAVEILMDDGWQKAREYFLPVYDVLKEIKFPEQPPEMQFELARYDSLMCEVRKMNPNNKFNPDDLKAARDKLQTALDGGAIGKSDVDAVTREYRSFKVLRPAGKD